MFKILFNCQLPTMTIKIKPYKSFKNIIKAIINDKFEM